MSLGLIHRRPVHPWVALRQAEQAIDRLSRAAAPARRAAGSLRAFAPRLEAVETEHGFDITAEMPGVAREDLEVFVQEGVLTISGVRRYGRRAASGAIDVGEPAGEAAAADAAESDAKAAEPKTEPKTEEVDDNVRFARQIRFNADVDEDAISARYADGLLEVRVPKRTPPAPEVRTIPVEVA